VINKHKLYSITLVSAVIILMLVSIAGAEQLVDVPNFGSNNYNDLNKVYENDIKTQDTAIEINPYDSEAWKNKGLVLVMLQKPGEALKAFNKAIEINPHYSDAWTGKGLALTELNKFDKAIKAYDKAIEINPQDSDAWTGKGLAFEGLNKPEEAIKAYDKAIELNPQDSIALKSKKALSLSTTGKPSDSVTESQDLVSQGIILGKSGQYNEAMKVFDKAIELNPQNSDAWTGKGLVFEGLNKPEEAMNAYDKALEIDPNDPIALQSKKALSLSNTGKLSEVVTESQDLVSQGAILAQSGQHDKAIKVFDKAIESNPQNSAAWSCKGIILTILGKYDEAIKAFDISTEINPLDSTCWAGKGLAFEGLNKPKEAIKAFDKAIEINPQNSIALKHKSALSKRDLSNTKQPADLNTEQPTYRSTEQSAYQDSQWLTTCISDSLVVNNDMKYLGTALKNIDLTSDNPDFTSTSTYANALYTDSQKAMDDSDLYNVSNDLQGAKDEHQLAMVQAQSAAVYIIYGVEEYKKGNFEAGNSEMKQAVPNMKSFREHDDRAASLSKAYKSQN
jgi:tetratricopeptide (TPR) repeat protein